MGIAALHLVHELNNLSILDVSKIVTLLLRVSSFRNSPVLSPMTRIDPSLASGACSEGRSPGAIKTSFQKNIFKGRPTDAITSMQCPMCPSIAGATQAISLAEEDGEKYSIGTSREGRRIY